MDTTSAIKTIFFIVIFTLFLVPSPLCGAEATVEQWGTFEIALPGPAKGNPFLDVALSARFTQGKETITVTGFYDGEGIYRVRFMPPSQGIWKYQTTSRSAELDGKSGTLLATKPTPRNRGPVRVDRIYHFAYADGTPYIPIGTTCYAWTHQSEELEKQTLHTLKASPFNKLRMCVFPKWYTYNRGEPPCYPFVGTAPNNWDFTRFHPAFFQHLEKRIGQLRELGIEADVILFHPYDKGHWGFDRMPAEADDRYVRYLVSRLSAYRNVWWSIANEFDFLEKKAEADWDRLFQLVQKADPYHHLRSIHNGTRIYNHTHPWVTHASIQNGSAVADFGRAILYRDVYRKPIVFDEVKYEGDLPERWGNLSGEAMVHSFWQGTIAGTYVGHGETYLEKNDRIWWSRGGLLRGSSTHRIAFLRKIVEEGPREGWEPIDKWQDVRTAGKKGEYYFVYFGQDKPSEWQVELPRGGMKETLRLRAEVIDTWDRTITPIDGVFEMKPMGRYRYTCETRPTIRLPGKAYQAIRLRKAP